MQLYSHKISVVVPIHAEMKNGAFFLWRLIQSLMQQTFTDYELVIVQEGRMAHNTNAGIKKATGEWIKILYLDDYFAHPEALQRIVDVCTPEVEWIVTGCLHQAEGAPIAPHYPSYSPDIYLGNNTIGSPSVLTIRNNYPLLFDENLSWLLDCELYYRYWNKHGPPYLLNDLNVIIGLHDGQTSTIMPSEEKLQEFEYLNKKYGK
ncbi:MAG TPA: hypothetical protein VHA52_08545 [Candidatus Babeliaceae bacterium]|nr:hypothetical protein [Candidatus Babeliaceae bacterium]